MVDHGPYDHGRPWFSMVDHGHEDHGFPWLTMVMRTMVGHGPHGQPSKTAN